MKKKNWVIEEEEQRGTILSVWSGKASMRKCHLSHE